MSLLDLSRALSDRRVSSVELTEECLRRIQEMPWKPFAYLDVDYAMAAARLSDQRRARGGLLGDLDGIPFAVEDRFFVKEMPCENNCEMLQGYFPPYDAHVVERLQSAGAILLGKMKTDGFLSGYLENNQFCENLVGEGGVIPFALLADTGGAWLKRGTKTTAVCVSRSLSRVGMIAVAPSFDGVGLMAASVADCAFLKRFLDKKIKSETEVSETSFNKIGVLQPAPPAVSIVGAEICVAETVNFDQIEGAYRILSAVESASEMAMYDGVRFGASALDGSTARQRISITRGRFFSFEEQRLMLVGTSLLMGEHRSGCYAAARGLRGLFCRSMKKLFEEYDVLVCQPSEEMGYLASMTGLSAVAFDGALWMFPSEREDVFLEKIDRSLAERRRGLNDGAIV